MAHSQLPSLPGNDDMLKTCFSLFLEKAFHTLNPGSPFLPNWHIQVLAEHLGQVMEGKIKRLIVNIPPRYMKSLTVSVAWPAWLLGNYPTLRVMVASYAQALSEKLSLDCRRLIQSPWYQQLFPEVKLMKDQNQKHKFTTVHHGFRLATSVDGVATGEGADILIADDPQTPLQAISAKKRKHVVTWFKETFLSRLDYKATGKVIVVMQRLHPDDVSGHLLRESSGWHHLCLPVRAMQPRIFHYHMPAFQGNGTHVLAPCTKTWQKDELLHPALENEEVVAAVAREMGSYAFHAQYMQTPASCEGNYLKRSWLKYYSPAMLPTAPHTHPVILSWDTAAKIGEHNSYSVCTVWQAIEKDYYLLEVIRHQCLYPDLKKLVKNTAGKWRPSIILMEDSSSGQSLLAELRREEKLPLFGIKVMKQKAVRFITATATFEAGRVWLPRHAPWLAQYEEELLDFPHGVHDDQADSTSQFILWANEYINDTQALQLRLI